MNEPDVFDHLDEIDDEIESEWDWESERTCSFPCKECGESWEDEDDSDE
jgi:hypothetical protein